MDLPADLHPWKKFRYRLEWLACLGVARLVPLLSRRACVGLARGLGTLIYRLDRRGQKVAEANLKVVFGERFGAAEREEIALRAYQNFARSILDLFWARRLTPENWRDYLLVEGDMEAFRQNYSTHGGVLMCIHWGNFEWCSLAVGFMGLPTTIVTETFKNPLLSEIFAQARGASGHTIIPQENSMIRLLKVVKRRGLAGMLIDLNFRPDQAATPIETFGRKMSVTFLHAFLAQRGGALLQPMHGESLPDGRCRVIFDPPLSIPPDATHQQIAQLCWNHFQPRILEHPELYMWAYKHWRYRPRAAAPEDYPFYANVSSKFEKLLASTPELRKGSKSGTQELRKEEEREE